MPVDRARIRALCFDVDGTLSDTDDLFVQRLARWLSPLRFLFPNRDVRPFARRIVMATESPGNFLYGLPDRLGLDDELAALGDLIYRLGLGKSRHPFTLVPGVPAMLQQLKPRYPMSIVSARGERSTRAFLEQFGLQDFFICVATSQTCAHTKPYPDPILWASEKMGVPAQNCLMIGDTTVDMRAARAAGAQAAGVLCGFGLQPELLSSGADQILATTPDLTELLGSGSAPAIE